MSPKIEDEGMFGIEYNNQVKGLWSRDKELDEGSFFECPKRAMVQTVLSLDI